MKTGRLTLWEAKRRAINEWCLARLWEKFRNSDHRSFGIISAWRPDRSEHENNEADERLRASIADYVPLVASSQQIGPNAEPWVLREPVYWVNDLSLQRALALAKEFGQGLFIWCGPETEGTVCLYDGSGTIVERWPQLDPDALAKVYERWRGRPVFFEADEQNFIGGMGRQAFVREFVNRLIDRDS